MPLESLKAKYEAFNWNVLEVNGNNISEFINAVEKAKQVLDKPTVIIAKTIPGMGVSFMENQVDWHGKAPNAEEAQKALIELKTLQGRINVK
jgi:transketolase